MQSTSAGTVVLCWLCRSHPLLLTHAGHPAQDAGEEQKAGEGKGAEEGAAKEG